MEWCEYRSPEGKPYYFNLKSSSSVWEKPQILKDYEGMSNFILYKLFEKKLSDYLLGC